MRGFSRSFSGGELTPEFFGQITDAKFQTGLALCRNFRVLPHGPVQNRAGTQFVRMAKFAAKRTRVIPFTYSTTQTMVLELGDQYIRFHTQGATLLVPTLPPAAWDSIDNYATGDMVSQGGVNYVCVLPNLNQAPPNATFWRLLPATGEYEVPTPYLEADLFDIHFVQSSDVLTLVHPNYPPMELRRISATVWELTTIVFTTTVPPPTAVTVHATRGGTPTTPTFMQYAVTSVAANNIDESLISSPAVESTAQATIAGITNANPGVFSTAAAHGLGLGASANVSGVLGMVQINGLNYTINSTPSGSSFTLALGGVPVDTTAFGAYSSGGQLFLNGVYQNLFDTGAQNEISWTAAPGAVRYNVYKFSNGLWAFVGVAAGTSFVDDNIAPDLGNSDPVSFMPFGTPGNYPGAVSYYEQRRTFGGTLNAPQSLWMTRSGTESNMTYSIPSKDTDSINFRVVAREANTIRHLVPLNFLLALTSAAEWRITSINTDALTQLSIDVKPQSYIGANNVQPMIVNSNLIYAAARGGHVRELAFTYNPYGSGYVTGDLSLRAPHLFDTFDIADATYSKAPYPMVWLASTNGSLIGLTYVPEQQIGAWHHHDTLGGSFESVTCVAEGVEDILYCVVNRVLNGTQVRTIERMPSRAFTRLDDCYFVDCGATYSGAAATTISGLTWLAGCLVSILADGAVVEPQTVSPSGTITLATAASTVQVGLAITADLQTLPLVLNADGFGQGQKKNINAVFLRVKDSSGIATGPSFDALTAFKQRTTEPYGSPPRLLNQEVQVVTKAAWTDDGQACVRQSDPLPLTVVSLTLDSATGG